MFLCDSFLPSFASRRAPSRASRNQVTAGESQTGSAERAIALGDLGCVGTWPQKKLGAPRRLLAVVAHFLPDALGATRNRFM